jgi:hypothetical protein
MGEGGVWGGCALRVEGSAATYRIVAPATEYY